MVRLNRLRLVVGALVSIAAATCQDPAAVRNNRAADDSSAVLLVQRLQLAALMQVATQSGQCWGIPEPGCTITYSAVPANYHCAVDYPCFVGENRPAQHEPIVVSFSRPVYRLVVYSGGGSFTCSGTYGTVAAYNRAYFGAGGRLVEQRDFALESPDDCGYDQQTFAGVDTLTFPGGIAKLVINPAQPWEYPVPTSDTTPPAQGYMQAEYYYYFYEKRPPTAPCVTGDELLDQQAMRDMLRVSWESSNANDIAFNRRETRGWLYEDSAGSVVNGVYPDREAIYPDTLMDTPCSSVGVPTGGLPGVPLAEGHTHPFHPGDTLPPNCPQVQNLKPGQFAIYDVKKYGGASGPDIKQAQSDSLPFYIVDRDTIYAYPLGTTLKNAKSVGKRYPRVDPATACVRL